MHHFRQNRFVTQSFSQCFSLSLCQMLQRQRKTSEMCPNTTASQAPRRRLILHLAANQGEKLTVVYYSGEGNRVSIVNKVKHTWPSFIYLLCLVLFSLFVCHVTHLKAANFELSIKCPTAHERLCRRRDALKLASHTKLLFF